MEKKGERERIAEREREAEKLLKKVYELRLLAEQTAKAPKARASEKQGGFCQECRRRRDATEEKGRYAKTRRYYSPTYFNLKTDHD